MKFYMPVKVYQEKNCVANHAQELCAFGKNALIVTGKHSSKVNGSLADVQKVLEQNDCSYTIFNEIEENPSVETVVKAAEMGKTLGVDFVIGIGGGSPLDAAKAIALLIKNPKESADALYESKALANLPLVLIPTTAGTGSEVTPVSVLTVHAEKTKKSLPHKIFGDLALIDSKYLTFASETITKNTYADVLGHLVESFLHSSADSYNRMCSIRGMQIWAKAKTAVLKNEISEEMYSYLSEASMLGGMAIAHTGTAFPHGMSYQLTYNYHVAHGKAVTVFLAAFLDMYENKEDVAQVLKCLGFEDVEALRTYIKDLVGTVTVTKADLETYAEDFAGMKNRRKAYPYAVNKEMIHKIYQDSLLTQE